MITDNVEKYGQTFFENQEVSNKTKSMIEQHFQSITDGLNIVNELLESGYGGLKIIVKNRKISYQKKNGSKFVDLPIDRLSSGEKRIIKLFLSVQFTDADIVLIDEPEVSLSLNFQSKLINDLLLLASTNRKKMILATHAPFIFEDCLTNGFERLEL